jgi:exodeoxyribonuclease V alpha subunit
VTATLRELFERGVLTPLDYHFAQTLGRVVDTTPELALIGAALASRAIGQGDVCVDLGALGSVSFVDADEQPLEPDALPSGQALRAALTASRLVSDGTARAPLVLQGDRLYLFRYYRYERLLAARVAERAGALEQIIPAQLQREIERLFPDTLPGDLQRRAVLIAAERRFVVVSGGPGTGKTHTVVRMLVLLQRLAVACGQQPLEMLLVAPTGKAAQRLSQSIGDQLAAVAPELEALVPREASTIQRALGFQPKNPTRFRHRAENPLPADVVVVDEASMVPLSLMAKLVDAVPSRARLILLGDKDQLSSVEAGAVLGDLYGAHDGGYSAPFASLLERLGERLPQSAMRPEPGLHDCLVHLTESHRYPAGSAIAELARLTNAGNTVGLAALLNSASAETAPRNAATKRRRAAPREQLALPFATPFGAPDPGASRLAADAQVRLVEPRSPEHLAAVLAASVRAGFSPYLAARTPEERLALLGRFRILCAHRRGPWGAEALNRLVERQLAAAGLLDADKPWYDGRPLIITHNDYQLELYNGDLGVVTEDSDGAPRAWFASSKGGLRSLPPARLPAHETVFAMTVHKSQGSEFDAVALVLPDRTSPVLTRELVYTAITRARKRVELYCRADVLSAAITRRIRRTSGLRAALWGETSP